MNYDGAGKYLGSKVLPPERVTEFAGLRDTALAHNRMVTVEAVHAEVLVTDPRDVEIYVEKFHRFERVALSGDDMRGLVEGIRDDFLREQETGWGVSDGSVTARIADRSQPCGAGGGAGGGSVTAR